MILEFTYKELAKNLGCSEGHMRQWLERYNVKIVPGKRGRHGTDAIIRISDATIRSMVIDSIEYAKNGRKPFVNFEGASWNRLDRLEKDLPVVELVGKDKNFIDYRKFEDNTSIKARETVYYLSNSNVVYKVVEDPTTELCHFRTLTDINMSEFYKKFNKETLMDEDGNLWIPVEIRNKKGQWINMPKKMQKSQNK